MAIRKGTIKIRGKTPERKRVYADAVYKVTNQISDLTISADYFDQQRSGFIWTSPRSGG
jgi:hypothetical protein